MSMSTDIVSTRRAISASRVRSNHQGQLLFFFGQEIILFEINLDTINQRVLNDSPEENSTGKFQSSSHFVYAERPVIVSFLFVRVMFCEQKTTFSPLVVLLTSHQLNPIDEQQNDHSIDGSSVSGTLHSSARPMPSTSFVYWLNTGDDNHTNSANFMRSTYAAMCRSHFSHSIKRCPRGIQPFPD